MTHSMYASLFWLLVSLTTGVEPERVLLLQDPTTASVEQIAVHHTLVQNLLADPGVDVVIDRPVAPSLQRAVALRQHANLILAEARRALQALQPQHAGELASIASQRFRRVAALTGDIAPLTEAMALQAMAYQWLGHAQATERVLGQLLRLDPGYAPDASLADLAMQKQFRRMRRSIERGPHTVLTVDAAPAHSAIFVDGRFAGFGHGSLEVACGSPHYVVAMAEHHSPRCTILNAKPGKAIHEKLTLVPDVTTDDAGGYANLVSTSQLATAFPDPSTPLLRAWSVDTVLILAYSEGALRLTSFDLRAGLRRETQTPAAITDLRDASLAAEALVANAPPLAFVPAPG